MRKTFDASTNILSHKCSLGREITERDMGTFAVESFVRQEVICGLSVHSIYVEMARFTSMSWQVTCGLVLSGNGRLTESAATSSGNQRTSLNSLSLAASQQQQAVSPFASSLSTSGLSSSESSGTRESPMEHDCRTCSLSSYPCLLALSAFRVGRINSFRWNPRISLETHMNASMIVSFSWTRCYWVRRWGVVFQCHTLLHG